MAFAALRKKTVAFHTLGCKVNQYEPEELRGQLQLGGFRVVPLHEEADVYVMNSCSVTADADSSCRQLARKILRERPASRIVVTGCYAERAPEELRDLSPRIEVFGNREKPIIALALGVPTACVETASKSGVAALAERARAYIKVQDGCDAHCTYCIIPSVRPELLCRAPEVILREARQLLDRGYREIVLTGVRLGRYHSSFPQVVSGNPAVSNNASGSPLTACGDDILKKARFVAAPDIESWDLVRLVRALLELPGDFRIRLSSLEVTEIPESLISLMKENGKLCPHFHIPLQSGDDEILKRMGRWYTADRYCAQARRIKERIPDVALTADVIVGFPGEEEEHFRNSARLLEEEGFSRLHVFRYSTRPGTPAERLPGHVDPRIKSARMRTLLNLDQTLRGRYAGRFLHRPVRVLQESDGSGYTDRYVRVRSASPLPEGAFHTLVPAGMTPQGVLFC